MTCLHLSRHLRPRSALQPQNFRPPQALAPSPHPFPQFQYLPHFKIILLGFFP